MMLPVLEKCRLAAAAADKRNGVGVIVEPERGVRALDVFDLIIAWY